MKRITLIAILTCFYAMATAQHYFSVDIGAGNILKEKSFVVSGSAGYKLETERWNGYAELSATYYTVNRGQVALLFGSTVFSEKVKVFLGITTYEEIYMGKYQPETRTKLGIPLQAKYQFKIHDFGRLDADMYIRGYVCRNVFGIGVGITSDMLR